MIARVLVVTSTGRRENSNVWLQGGILQTKETKGTKCKKTSFNAVVFVDIVFWMFFSILSWNPSSETWGFSSSSLCLLCCCRLIPLIIIPLVYKHGRHNGVQRYFRSCLHTHFQKTCQIGKPSFAGYTSNILENTTSQMMNTVWICIHTWALSKWDVSPFRVCSKKVLIMFTINSSFLPLG